MHSAKTCISDRSDHPMLFGFCPKQGKIIIFLFHPLGCDECSFPWCFPSLQPFFSSWEGSSTGYVHLADAGGKQGGGGKPARGHSITGDAFWGKETLLGGILFAVGDCYQGGSQKPGGFNVEQSWQLQHRLTGLY